MTEADGWLPKGLRVHELTLTSFMRDAGWVVALLVNLELLTGGVADGAVDMPLRKAYFDIDSRGCHEILAYARCAVVCLSRLCARAMRRWHTFCRKSGLHSADSARLTIQPWH